MKLALITIGALVLAASGSASAAVPVFPDNEINQQLAKIDIAGIHFGDTLDQVRQTMRAGGWTVSLEQTFGGRSFRDKVGYEVNVRRGLRYTPKDGNIPLIAEYRKGPQELEVNYCPHSRGHLVCRIYYRHRNATSGAALREFQNLVTLKFSKMPLVAAEASLYCLPQDLRCLRAPSRGDVMSDLPSIYLTGSAVTLHEGDLGKKVFADDLREAIDRESGGLEDISL